ncbi:rasGEF domain-containing protein [Naegleria gruberi]|uniref:RasGEF domain-containing protein n=1 Tax=Naegleria gruberi TaxID=5762 RepID=D2VJ65_NAEGR|nr:rasGEF domain-containing protein [Naegleria gruberi]EFC43225.1 rasGEF domain-containing protein [Naegleria gruberi]|eukprot:XP_002675969.1 rasGEF domain-containing protein [Naegleria gruberi strain NEG-M]
MDHHESSNVDEVNHSSITHHQPAVSNQEDEHQEGSTSSSSSSTNSSRRSSLSDDEEKQLDNTSQPQTITPPTSHDDSTTTTNNSNDNNNSTATIVDTKVEGSPSKSSSTHHKEASDDSSNNSVEQPQEAITTTIEEVNHHYDEPVSNNLNSSTTSTAEITNVDHDDHQQQEVSKVQSETIVEEQNTIIVEETPVGQVIIDSSQTSSTDVVQQEVVLDEPVSTNITQEETLVSRADSNSDAVVIEQQEVAVSITNDNTTTSNSTSFVADVAISVEQPTPRLNEEEEPVQQHTEVTSSSTSQTSVEHDTTSSASSSTSSTNNNNTVTTTTSGKLTITSYNGPLPPPPATPPPPMTEEEKRRQQKLMKMIASTLSDDTNGKSSEQKSPLPVNMQAMDPFSIEEIDQTQWMVLFNTGSLRNQTSRRILMRSSSMRIQQHSNSMLISSGGGSVNTSLNTLGSPSEQNALSPATGNSTNESSSNGTKTSPSKENSEHKGLLVKNFFRFLSYGGGYLQKVTKKSSDADTNLEEVVYFKFPHVRHCLQVFYKPFKILHYEANPYRMSPFKPQYAILNSEAPTNSTTVTTATQSTEHEDKSAKKNKKEQKKSEEEENQDTNDDDILPSMSKILDIEKAQAEKATEVQTSKDPEELFRATEQMGDFTESGLSKKLKNALSRSSNRDSIAASGSGKSSSAGSPAATNRDKRKSIWNNIFKTTAQNTESSTKKDDKEGKEGSETKKEVPTIDPNDPNFPRQMSFTSLVTNQQNLSEKEIANLQKKTGEKKAVDAFDEIDISKSLKKSLVEKAKELCAKRPLELLNELTAELQKTDSLSVDPQKKLNDIAELNRKNVQKDTKRLMGVLQPRYEYKPLHTTMCQRFPEIEYPVKKKFRFQLSCSDFIFMDSTELQNDLFTFSVAIYDAKYLKKVSEDYHFHMFTDEQLMKLPESLHNSLQKRGVARTEKRLFSVSSPNEEMFLVLFVNRVSNGPTKDTIKAHKKKEFSSEFLEKKDKLAFFRYPAFFGFVPLFKINEKKIELTSSILNFEQMFFVEGDYKNPLNVYSALKQKTKHHSVNATMKVYVELISDLQKYKLSKPSEDTGAGIGDSQLIYKQDSEDSGSINEDHSSYQTPNNYLGDDSTDVANVMEEEDEESEAERRNSVILNSGDFGKALFEEQMKILESISVNEIPWYKIRYPYMNLQNTLYVYPQGVKLEKANGKNILIEVIFRESDSTIPTLEELQKSNPVIINRFTSEKKHSEFSALEYDNKTPQFLDEIKLDIPAVSNKGNHLLFTFYHIDIDKKSNKLKYEFLDRKDDFGNSDRAILGYSFLDLTEKNKIYEADKAQAIYQLKHTDFQKQFFTGELRVYKELQPDYLTKSQTKGTLEKISDARFKLMAQLVSTINPRDDILKLFFASIHDLYSPETENKEKILEYICRSILMKFCDIDFSLFMPHLPIVMNILFELMSNISDLSIHSTDLRKGAERLIFEQVLVCLRGVYHLTKNHTRGNKFMASYTKYIFDEMNRGYPIYSVLTRVFTDYLEELTKILQEPTKHYFVTNNLTEHDPFRFSWFIFDVIIKSLTLCIKTDSLDCLTIKDSWYLNKSNDGYGWNDEHPLSQEYFVRKVKQLMHHFCSRTKKLLSSSGSGRQNIGLNSNRNLALFIRDLIPFIDREYYIDIVKHYMDCLSGDASTEALLRLKSEFVAILCDYDYFIPLNSLQLQEGNFMVRHLFDVFFATIETNNEKLMLKVGKYLLDLFCKIDFDSRYQDTSKRAAIAEIFLYFVDRYMDKEEYLTMFHNDELYILTSFCLLWVLRNLSEQRLIQWWTQAPLHVMINCISFLDYVVMSVHHLDYSSSIPKERKKGGQRNIRIETVLSVNYILSKITEKNVLNQIFENINVKYPIDKLLANKEEYVQVISKLEITRNTKTMTPVKSLLLRSISRLIFNMIFQLTMKDEFKVVSLIFQDCLHPFLTSFNHSLVCPDLYDLTIPKKDRVPYAQKRKVEQKWRWLLGACSLYTEELMGDKAIGESIQISKECMALLLEPFSYVLNFESEVDLEDEPEDVNVDIKRSTISSGTLKKLVEKFVGMLTLEGETELRGVFHSTFLNTFSSFTTARSLMNRLMGVYRSVIKNNTVRLYIEQAMNELLKEAFHALDNEAVALYAHYFEEIAQPIRKKQQEDGAKRVHPTLKKIRKTLVQNLLSFKKDESGSTSHHGQSNTVMIPKGVPIEKLKEPEISLNQWKIQKSKYINEGMPNPYNIQFNLLSWPATEIARQETIIDLKIFKKIEANEFYNSAWSDIKYKYELAPHISSLTDRVNNISYWVQTTILTESNTEIRKALFKKFVEIAKETYELNNYSAFFAIISGLQSVPVYRLKETRKVLSQDDANIFKIFDDLHANNRIKLRENLKNTIVNNNTPIVPFIGIFQTDLTFTSDGNPDEFNHPKNPNKKLINYQKRRIYYNTIQTVKDLQSCSNLYRLEPIPYLQYVLKEQIFEGIITNDDELHKKSLVIEPRKAQ